MITLQIQEYYCIVIICLLPKSMNTLVSVASQLVQWWWWWRKNTMGADAIADDCWYLVFENIHNFQDCLAMGQTCKKLHWVMSVYRAHIPRGMTFFDQCVISVDTAPDVWPPSTLETCPTPYRRRFYKTLGYRNIRGQLHGPTLTCAVDESCRLLTGGKIPKTRVNTHYIIYAIFHYNFPCFPVVRMSHSMPSVETIDKELAAMNALVCTGNGHQLFALTEQRRGYKFHSKNPFKLSVCVAATWSITIETISVYPSYDGDRRIVIEAAVIFDRLRLFHAGKNVREQHSMQFLASVSNLEEIIDVIGREFYKQLLLPVKADYGERLQQLLAMQLTTRQLRHLLRHEPLRRHLCTIDPAVVTPPK